MKLLAVLIHDEPALRDLLAEMLGAWGRHEVTVEKVGYASRLPGSMKRWLLEADIFILGLERYYAEGRCAEGVDAAAALWNLDKKVLVVGSESNAMEVSLPFYWDIADERNFLEAVRGVLDSPVPNAIDRKKLGSFFEWRRHKPVGHGTSRNLEGDAKT